MRNHRVALPLGALLLAACELPPTPTAPDARPDAAVVTVDSRPPATDGAREAAPPVPQRTILQRPLFGETHPENLLIDPVFGIRGTGRGLGAWLPVSQDPSSVQGAQLSSLYLSDSPSGLGLPVGRLSDARDSTGNFRLDMVAQVAGGPGPFNLRLWVSTLDASASASLSGVTIGLLTSLSGEGTTISEDPSRARVIAGRTWHYFTGTITQSLKLGAYVMLDFAPSKNTWLLQAPEFIPKSIDPAMGKLALTPARARPMTTHERQLITRYQRQPRISVPGGHPSLSEQPATLLRCMP